MEKMNIVYLRISNYTPNQGRENKKSIVHEIRGEEKSL